MNRKISWRSGRALPVLLVSAALTACSAKTPTGSTPETAVALLRYNANGTPDTTNLVGGTGLVTTDVNPFQNDLGFAVVLQPADGKIIAVGNTQAGVAVIRYNANGTLDTTFGSGGITVKSLPSAGALAFAATLQTDGKLLVAGRSSPSSGPSSFLLLRYHTDNSTGAPGTLDTSFGTQGIVTTPIPSSTGSGAQAVAVSGTNIVVAGRSMMGGKFVIALAQYTSSGAPDPTFGSGTGTSTGIVTKQIASGDTDAAALAVQPADSKIVVAGLAGNAATQMWNVALLRYNADGTPDLPFGGNNTGFVTNNISSSSTYANAVALQADGKIVVAGNAFADPFVSGTSDIAVLRYKTDGTLDTTGFGNPNGYVTKNIGAFDNGSAVAVQPLDQKIVVAGNADAGVADRLALLRYNGDGSLDSNFGTAGIVTRDASGPGTIAGAQGVVLQPQPGGEIVVVGYD